MESKEFLDLVHELIVVDTDEGLVKETSADGQAITVKLTDGTNFKVSVEKI